MSTSADTLGALVERIMERADGLAEGYRRVGLLIAAAETVTESLALTPRLQTIVSVARELVGARYGALGVIGADGRLERFLHSGLDQAEVARMGELPSGRGILGAVIVEGRSIRLEHLAADPRSVGFPAHHPAMDSFLGVPIHVGGTVYGNLYLTEHSGGPFDDIDEAIIAALAAMAGTAIANSRLYEQSQDDRRWLAASEHLTQRLLAGELDPDDLTTITATVRALTDDPAAEIEETADGQLVVRRAASGHPAADAELEPIDRFTRSVSIARELARARIDQQRIALADERDRIARDLHDHVIQSLFAVGLSLQSVVGDPATPTGGRIAAQVDAIDSTIRQIRQAIYRLSAPPSAASYSLRARINTLVRETLEGEHLDSRLEFAGPVDTLVDLGLGDEVAAVTREALSNTVRHASATLVEVGVAVRGTSVVVTVRDDGVGMPATERRSGLANLAARARERGGEFAIEPVEPHGTLVRWSVPWEAR
ncbi:GAF domain-containing protein [Microcella frigidaquae]|uniref:Signal transduction histidine kinase n=1 Tax=Microcella frigidaquae TaxID=424758 RepID=A0A840X4U6_9MICO|nr:signal transduction histidine kinase [Microcella frigidaquae]NHN45040.1 GAF domain-containing protein [Microcella frigidaquae]